MFVSEEGARAVWLRGCRKMASPSPPQPSTHQRRHRGRRRDGRRRPRVLAARHGERGDGERAARGGAKVVPLLRKKRKVRGGMSAPFRPRFGLGRRAPVSGGLSVVKTGGGGACGGAGARPPWAPARGAWQEQLTARVAAWRAHPGPATPPKRVVAACSCRVWGAGARGRANRRRAGGPYLARPNVTQSRCPRFEASRCLFPRRLSLPLSSHSTNSRPATLAR